MSLDQGIEEIDVLGDAVSNKSFRRSVNNVERIQENVESSPKGNSQPTQQYDFSNSSYFQRSFNKRGIKPVADSVPKPSQTPKTETRPVQPDSPKQMLNNPITPISAPQPKNDAFSEPQKKVPPPRTDSSTYLVTSSDGEADVEDNADPSLTNILKEKKMQKRKLNNKNRIAEASIPEEAPKVFIEKEITTRTPKNMTPKDETKGRISTIQSREALPIQVNQDVLIGPSKKTVAADRSFSNIPTNEGPIQMISPSTIDSFFSSAAYSISESFTPPSIDTSGIEKASSEMVQVSRKAEQSTQVLLSKSESLEDCLSTTYNTASSSSQKLTNVYQKITIARERMGVLNDIVDSFNEGSGNFKIIALQYLLKFVAVIYWVFLLIKNTILRPFKKDEKLPSLVEAEQSMIQAKKAMNKLRMLEEGTEEGKSEESGKS